MVDCFSDALADPGFGVSSIPSVEATAPSKGSPPLLETIDLDSEGEQILAETKAPSQESSPHPSSKSHTFKALASSAKKRRMDTQNWLQVQPVEPPPNTSVQCIFVETGKKDRRAVAVPLWPQYTVAWKGNNFQQATWIIVGNYERWVMQLLDVVSLQRVFYTYLLKG